MIFETLTRKEKREYILKMAKSNNCSRNQLAYIKSIVGLFNTEQLSQLYLYLKERGYK